MGNQTLKRKKSGGEGSRGDTGIPNDQLQWKV